MIIWSLYKRSLISIASHMMNEQLPGALDANGTTFSLTDALGSILSSFSNTPSSAVVKGNQVFGPYGKARYTKGTINTAKN